MSKPTSAVEDVLRWSGRPLEETLKRIEAGQLLQVTYGDLLLLISTYRHLKRENRAMRDLLADVLNCQNSPDGCGHCAEAISAALAESRQMEKGK